MLEQLPAVPRRGLGDIPDGTDGLIFVVDAANGAFVAADPAAEALFAMSGDELFSHAIGTLVPELMSLEPRAFVTRLATASGTRNVAVSVQPLRGHSSRDRAAGARVAVSMREIDGATPGERRDRRLESLWDLVVRRGLSGADHVRAVLREAVAGMGLDAASLARVGTNELIVAYTDRGDVAETPLPLDRSLAAQAVLRSGSFSILDTAVVPELAAIAGDTRSFLAAAFRVGDVRWVLTVAGRQPRAEPFQDDDWHYVETVVDALARAIERRESDARIERLAYSDALTSLPNRPALHARLDAVLEESARVEARTAVLFLDVDGFKSVNDTVGHRGGDVVLAEIAHRLRGTLRREEFIGRLGGDEFAIIMPHVTDRAEIDSIAQRIGGVLTAPFNVDDYRFSLSASIGVAIFPDDGTKRDELLASADAAMYAAKDEGGARIRFRESPAALADDRAPAVTAVTAVAGDVRDIGYILCYQPIVAPRDGRVIAAEALIRRIHPAHGLLAPERGWSIARDEAGRRALDRWVLREAATQARVWSRAGTPMRIDVNLAAFDTREIDVLLADEALAGDVRRLRIEIAADQFGDASQAGRIAVFVDHCARNGIGFALDGFDGSLGSLSSLSHLPIDALKLERPLVESLLRSPTAHAIIEGTMIVAKSLGWSVIAKGVETAMQQEALVALGCDGIQGFHVAHPMTAGDFGTWLGERRFVGKSA
ncbi:MAG: hypothetical protein NVSMB19_01950 [Vulcanimicrobiaceae bacterium]